MFLRILLPLLASSLLTTAVTAPIGAAQAHAGDEPEGAGAYGPAIPFDSVQTGMASYYHDRFEGRRTASGERFAQLECTAAHPWLPFGSVLRVTNLDNHREVLVRVNDRRPFTGGRIVDVSRSAAEELGMIRSGTARVRVELLRLGNG